MTNEKSIWLPTINLLTSRTRTWPTAALQHTAGMLFTLNTDCCCMHHLLTLQRSGSPKQSFPLFFSSRPQSAGNSWSLPSDLKELIVLGPKKTCLTPLVKGLGNKRSRFCLFLKDSAYLKVSSNNKRICIKGSKEGSILWMEVLYSSEDMHWLHSGFLGSQSFL